MTIDAATAATRTHGQTGPRTEAGKAKSSRNAIRTGLYAARDFIRPEEEEEYVQTLIKLMDKLTLDPMIDERTEKTYREHKDAPPYEIIYTAGRHWKAGDPMTETDSSICNPAPKPQPPAAAAPKMTPRNAPCPCGSGAKYKRCCGPDATPVLNRVA